jgi:hypothetical protein
MFFYVDSAFILLIVLDESEENFHPQNVRKTEWEDSSKRHKCKGEKISIEEARRK